MLFNKNVYDTDAECQILHHASHSTHLRHSFLRALSTFFQQVLYASIGVYLHSTEVRKAVDESCFLTELLTEGITKIVCRVCRYQEYRFSDLSKLDSQGA